MTPVKGHTDFQFYKIAILKMNPRVRNIAAFIVTTFAVKRNVSAGQSLMSHATR